MSSTLTQEYVRQELRNIIDNEEVSTRDKLNALKMAGEHLKMFESNKRSILDVRMLFAQLNKAQLEGLTNGGFTRSLSSGSPEVEDDSSSNIIDVEPELDTTISGVPAKEDG